MNWQDQPDPSLLEAFGAGREAAFTELVRRHGGLVRGVCVRMLGETPDADDAVQAVFLVLAKKAAGLTRRASAAAWLHRVAVNVCRNARRAEARRAAHELEAGRMRAATDRAGQAWARVAPRLDGVLGGLPERFRAPLLLHHIEGLTKEEVGERLGWKEGTVSSRLHRARELLRRRLARRGVSMPAGILIGLVNEYAAAAALAPTAAGKIGATGSAATAATTLAEETMRAMLITKLVKITAALVVAGGVTAAAGVAAKEQPPEPAPKREVIAAAPRAPAPPPVVAQPAKAVAEPSPATEPAPHIEPPARAAPAPARPQQRPPAPRKPQPQRVTDDKSGGARLIPRLNGIVTLLALAKHEAYELATYRFDWKDSPGKSPDAADILYGDGPGDVLRTDLAGDDRGWIRDLGKHGWDELSAVRTALTDARGRGKPRVTLQDDHLYRLRIRDRGSDLHILLHVDRIRPGDQCTLSWALFDPRDFAQADEGEIARPQDPQPLPGRESRPEPPRRGPIPPDPNARGSKQPFAHREGTATIVSRTTYDDFLNATYSFVYARRNDPDLQVTLNNWDIVFGNDQHPELDEFRVNMVTTDRCRIHDLGPMTWSEVDKRGLPSLRERTDDEDQRNVGDMVRVVLGHMYLIRTVSYGHYLSADQKLVEGKVEDFYTLVRVESHLLNDRCTLSWRIIDAPGTGDKPLVRALNGWGR